MLGVKRFIEKYRVASLVIMASFIIFVVIIDNIYFKFLLSLVIDDSTGLIDKNILWNAIGSISTTIAVIIALFQYSIQNRKRIQLSFSQATLVQPGVVGPKFLVLSISNIGLKTINIQSWRFIIKGKNHYMLFPTDPYGNNIKFPLSLSSEESMDLYFQFDSFSKLMKDYFDKNRKLTMYVVDSVGSRYYLTTDAKISYYLED